MKLDGKVAVVTGGTRGIGRGITEAYLAEGASVVMVGRNVDTAEKVMAEAGMGERLAFEAGDVAVSADADRCVGNAVERYGRVDILAHCAGGIVVFKPLHEWSNDEWSQHIAWNLDGTFYVMRAAIKHMLTQGGGRIINISSFQSKKSTPNFGAYVAAKAGVNAVTQLAARELGAANITVNAICVGVVPTELLRSSGELLAESYGVPFEEAVDGLRLQMASQKLQSTDTISAMAVLLASHAGESISGQAYSFDGGLADY